MNIIALVISFAAGLILAYVILYFINKANTVGKGIYDSLLAKFNELNSDSKVQGERLSAAVYENTKLSTDLAEKSNESRQLQVEFATLQEKFLNAEIKNSELISTQEKEAESNRNHQIEISNQNQKIAELSANIHSTGDQLNSIRDVNEKQAAQIEKQIATLNDLIADKSRLSANNAALNEKLSTQKTEMEEMQISAHLQFEKIANQIFEEKSTKFTQTNKSNIESLLNPLKEDIGKFKTKVEETYDKESKQRFSLEEKVKELIEQTNKVSNEANNLANALKGQTKKQGNWGEMILERILESSGLTKDREYFLQETIKDEDGRSLRPDVLIRLPDDRIVIIDSKVSLVAYDRFWSAEMDDERKIFLSEHLKSIYSHINGLHEKKYDNLESSLDFTMMFIPIEPAYMISIQADQELWAFAYAKRVLLVSPTNLIACLKLISDLWNREKQSKNAMEIVKRGELLYDKFVAFTSSIEEIGKNLNRTQAAYSTALDQLKNGRGNMIGQALHLKSLGLKSAKKIPSAMLPLDIEEPDAKDEESV